MKGFAVAACAAALAGSGCAGAGRGARRPVEVTVEVRATVGADGLEGARRRALEEARRRALEQGAGVRLASLSLSEGGVMRVQRIRTASAGTVRELRVLGERREGGALALRVRARVAEDEGAAGGWPAGLEPRLFVAALGPRGGRAALLRAWRRRGGGAAATPEEADLVVSAEWDCAAQPDPRLRPFVSWRARVRLSDSGGAAAPWELEREAAALGLDEKEARDAAVESAAGKAADALAALPPASWLRGR